MTISIIKEEKRLKRKRTEHLPESDGKPMAETDIHRRQMIDLLNSLTEYFRSDENVYVTGNIFLYLPPDENAPDQKRKSVSPDIFLVRGISKKDRRIYDMAVEKKAPDLVIELASLSTREADMGKKYFLYADLGVSEYFIFDPLKEVFASQLRGFRLIGGEYAALSGMPVRSEVLGLDLVVEGGKLRLYNANTGERLRTHEEAEAELRAETEARRKAEAEKEQLLKELAALRRQKK